MGKTILTHRGCGGSVVEELTGYRLVSPYIAIGYSKVTVSNFQFLTKDFKTPKGETETNTKWVCMKCGEEIIGNKVKTDILAECVVCKNTFPAGELFSTDYTAVNCKNCIDSMKDEDQADVKKMFDIPARLRKSLLSDILSNSMIKV